MDGAAVGDLEQPGPLGLVEGTGEADLLILEVAVKTISNFTNHFFETPLDGAFASRSWLPG